MVYIYGIIYPKKIPIDVAYKCFKNLAKYYLKTIIYCIEYNNTLF